VVPKRRNKTRNTAQYPKFIAGIFAVSTCDCYSRRLAEKPHCQGFSAFPQITGFLELTKPEEKF
jgi:hypothetical protein